MKFKKLFAGVAAAATLLAGMAFGTGAANVSLTSYGKRISTVWQTIETIGAGTVKPHRLTPVAG